MIYAVLQMLSLLTGHILIKYGFGEQHPLHILVMMYICAVAMLVVVVALRPSLVRDLRVLAPYKKIVIFLLFLSFFNAASFYAALYYIGLSGVAILGRLSTVLMIVSGVVFFQERLGATQWVFIGLVLVSGFMFAMSGGDVQLNLLGSLFAVMAASSWVAMSVMIKKYSDRIKGHNLVVLRVPFMFVAFGLSFLALVYAGWVPALAFPTSPRDIAFACGAAFFLPIMVSFLFPMALEKTDLSTVSVLYSMRPALSFFAGIVLFAEAADHLKLIAGSVSIVAGIGYSVLIYKEKHTSEDGVFNHHPVIRDLCCRLLRWCRL